MKKEDEKVNFDLSTLSLEELIEVYSKIGDFLEYLDESKLVIEEKEKEEDD